MTIPRLIIFSVALQAPLALFLGHAYDLPIFMATGYLAATGLNPYVARDLSAAFHDSLFAHLTSIGYPPPWPLVLGGMYRLSFALIPSLALYRLAIKAPVIAANVLLALVVRRLSASAGAGERESKRAMTLVLFNPLILYATAAWGQFDGVVALLAMIALDLLCRRKGAPSAVVLALAVSLKPTALALVPLCALSAGKRPGSIRATAGFAVVAAAAIIVFSAVPFALLGWSPRVILNGWDSHLTSAGGLSWLTFFDLAFGTHILPPALRFLGYLWLPALAAGTLLIRPRGRELTDLLLGGLRLTLLLFLTRAWLSEPNVALLLPMAAVLAAAGRMDWRVFHGLWIATLVFTLFNASVPQVLAPAWPQGMQLAARLDEKGYAARLFFRCLAVVPWLVIGWRIVLARPLRREKVFQSIPEAPPSADNRSPILSLVLPTYQESQNVAEVIHRAEAALEGMGKDASEIIVVDDGSPDGTAAVVGSLSVDCPNVRVVNRGHRQGLAGAIRDGIAASRGDIVAVMDADLQHPPEALGELWRSIRAGADIAVMSRYLPGAAADGQTASRRAASRCGVVLTHLLLPSTRVLTDPLSGYFMVRRESLVGVRIAPRGFKVLPAIVSSRRGMAVREIPFTLGPRRKGRSKMRALEIIRYVRLLLSIRRGECP